MVLRALVVQRGPERAVTASLADVEVEAVFAPDGPAVVAAVGSFAPDVVLVDLTLPPLDGWCVLAAVGAVPGRPLLVVRVSDASEAGRAVALGADAWVDDAVHVVSPAGRLAFAIAA